MKKTITLALVVPEAIHPHKQVFFHGESVEEVLKELHDWAFFEQDFTQIEGCTFQVTDLPGLYEFSGTYFHYCLDKGRIDVEELLETVKYEK